MPSNEKSEFLEKQMEQTTPELKVGNSEPTQSEIPKLENAVTSVESNSSIAEKVETAPVEQIRPQKALPKAADGSIAKWFSSQNKGFLLAAAALGLVATQGIAIEQFRQTTLTEVAFAYGADKPGFVGAVHDLTYFYYWHRKPDVARLVTERAVAHLTAVKQDRGYKEAYLLAGLAAYELNADNTKKGNEVTDQVITALENKRDEIPALLPFELTYLGRALEDKNDYARAQKIFEKASELFPENRQKDALDALFHVGYDYNHLGEFSKAQKILQKVVGSKDLNYRDRPKALRALGVAYEGLKEYKLAELNLQKSIDGAYSIFRNARSSVAFSQIALGRVKNATGDKVKGEQLIKAGFDTFESMRDDHHYDYNDAKLNLANIYRDNGKFAEARGLYNDLLKEIADHDYAGPQRELVVSASDLLRKQSGK